jgi:hypothetical protein
MGILAQAKIVMNSFGNRNLMQPMGRLSMHSKCLDFFVLKFFGGGASGGRILKIFPLFLTCSLQVPNGKAQHALQVP